MNHYHLPNIFYTLLALAISSVAYGNSVNGVNSLAIEFTIKTIPNTIDSVSEFTYEVTGQFIDSKTTKPVGGVQVTIVNNKNRRYHSQQTGADGAFQFELHDQSVYSITGVKPLYFESEKISISTVGRRDYEKISVSMPISQIIKGDVYPLEAVGFSVNDWTLDNDGEKSLERIVRAMQSNPTLRIEIGVHTDARGDDEYNLRLSVKRAHAIHTKMKALGMYSGRLVVKGYGETKPLNHCGNDVKCSSAEHLENRRIEVKVVGL